MRLTRDDILKADDIQTREVEVPEWGGTVLVQGLTGTERDAFEESMVTIRGNHAKRDLKNARAKLVARCIVDDEGTRLFSDRDIASLGAKSGVALNRVYEVAAELSGIGDDAEADAEGN